MNYGSVISNSSYIGGIAGQSIGEINGAYNRANVTGFGNVGGIVGMNSGNITNAYNIEPLQQQIVLLVVLQVQQMQIFTIVLIVVMLLQH